MGSRKNRRINSQTYYVTVTFCDRLFGRDGSVGRSTDHWHVIHTGKLPFLDTQGLWGKLSTMRRELVSTEATTTRVLETEEDFVRGLLLGRRLAIALFKSVSLRNHLLIISILYSYLQLGKPPPLEEMYKILSVYSMNLPCLICAHR